MGDTTVESREPPRGVTFEEVWAMIRETDRQMKETDRRLEENARQMKKMRAEADQQMKEMRAEADRRIAETDRQIGKLGNRLGDIIENLLSPQLHKKFNALGFVFTRSSRNIDIRDHKQNHLTEIDVLLENGDYVLAVEVKTRPAIEDVQEHLERMGILRGVADEHEDKRKYLGAVAGASFSDQVRAYTLKKGLYAIIPSGETVDIEAPGAGGPRIW